MVRVANTRLTVRLSGSRTPNTLAITLPAPELTSWSSPSTYAHTLPLQAFFRTVHTRVAIIRCRPGAAEAHRVAGTCVLSAVFPRPVVLADAVPVGAVVGMVSTLDTVGAGGAVAGYTSKVAFGLIELLTGIGYEPWFANATTVDHLSISSACNAVGV